MGAQKTLSDGIAWLWGRGDAGVPVGTSASGRVPSLSLYSSSLPGSKPHPVFSCPFSAQLSRSLGAQSFFCPFKLLRPPERQNQSEVGWAQTSLVPLPVYLSWELRAGWELGELLLWRMMVCGMCIPLVQVEQGGMWATRIGLNHSLVFLEGFFLKKADLSGSLPSGETEA